MRQPVVSVLVPCFNHGQWIDEAIDSVFAQTVQDFDVIIVDDGSTDPATVDKLAAYERPRTRVVRTENRGLSAARNLAASLAAGQFYCALDADDRLAPNWFERALAAFDRDPELAFVSHWVQAFGDEQWLWQPESCGLLDLLVNNVVNSAALVRREVFEGVGGFDETMHFGCEDWDFWLRIVEAGRRGHIVQEPLYFYRRYPQSMSREMVAGDAYRIAMEQLLDRHSGAFATHAADVFVAKDLGMTSVALELHKLERDRVIHTQPRLQRLREDYGAVKDSIEAARLEDQQIQKSPLVTGLRADVESARGRIVGLQRELESAQRREAALQNDAVVLQAHAAALQSQVQGLRASWSWKLTAPVRFVGAFFMK